MNPAEDQAKLDGRRIFVVEDSPLIADLLDDILKDLGCTVVGPTGNMAFAIEQATAESFDAAIVDINIRGGKVFPVTDILIDRNIPFLLASGYADWKLPDSLLDRPRLHKPYTKALVQSALAQLFSSEPHGGSGDTAGLEA